MGATREVFVKVGDNYERREVALGLYNEKMVEIRSGLSEGDEIVVNPKVLLDDKDKTKTREPGEGKQKNGDNEKFNYKGGGMQGGFPGGGGMQGGGFPGGAAPAGGFPGGGDPTKQGAFPGGGDPTKGGFPPGGRKGWKGKGGGIPGGPQPPIG
jgi:hypothetical protein